MQAVIFILALKCFNGKASRATNIETSINWKICEIVIGKLRIYKCQVIEMKILCKIGGNAMECNATPNDSEIYVIETMEVAFYDLCSIT